MKKTKRCKLCVLTNHFKNITFNKDSVCSYCQNYNSDKAPDITKDESVLYNIKNNSSKTYDVLVAYSGGKDSTYILYQLIKKYKLKVLAFTFDNHFVSKKTFENIEHISKQLQFDHVVLKYNFEFTKICFNQSVEACKKNIHEDLFRTFGIVCWPCFVMLAIGAINLAKSYGIKYMCGGWSLGQTVNLYKISDNTRDDGFLEEGLVRKNFIDPFLKLLNIDFIEPQIELYKSNALKNDISVIPYFIFEKYNEDRILSIIKKELDWQKPKDTDGCSTNCLLNSYGNYLFKEVYYYNRYEEQLSRQIRQGLMTRESALEQTSKEWCPDLIDKIKLALN